MYHGKHENVFLWSIESQRFSPLFCSVILFQNKLTSKNTKINCIQIASFKCSLRGGKMFFHPKFHVSHFMKNAFKSNNNLQDTILQIPAKSNGDGPKRYCISSAHGIVNGILCFISLLFSQTIIPQLLSNSFQQVSDPYSYKGPYIKYVERAGGGRGGGLESFCGGHEIFQAYIDGP